MPLNAKADATEAAFGALLSMPDAAPRNGSWGDFAVPAPKDFDGSVSTEEDLIAYLDQQRKEGAKFDSYRLQGTLFHHAVRSKLEGVALWLLRRGANPRLALESAPEMDGLAIALQVEANQVVAALRKLPAFSNVNAPQVQKRLQAQLQAHFFAGDAPQISAFLIANKGFAASPVSCTAFLGGRPEPAKSPTITVAQWRTAINSLPPALRAEAWPCAFKRAADTSEANAMLAASGIDPWRDSSRDPALAGVALRLSGAHPAWRSRLRNLPAAAVASVLNDEMQLQWLLRTMASLPIADFQWTLSAVKPHLTPAFSARILGTWRSDLGGARSPKLPDTAERWKMLAEIVPPGLGQSLDSLTYTVPIAQWPLWLAKGYALPQPDLKHWIVSSATLEELKLAYPLLQKFAPDAAKNALSWIVAPLSDGGAYYDRWEPMALRKAEFFASVGGKVAKARPLARLFRGDKGLAPEVAQAVARGWVLDVPVAKRPVVEVVKDIGCKPVVSPALRLSMTSLERWRAPSKDPFFVDKSLSDVQAIQQEGNANCLWFGMGGEPPGRKFIEDIDFFEGAWRLTPCADGGMVNAFWSEAKNDWVASPDYGSISGSMWPIMIKGTHTKAFLEWREDGGGCAQSRGYLYTLTVEKGQPAFTAANEGSPMIDALGQQCEITKVDECLGLFESPEAGKEVKGFTWSELYLPKERGAFLKAIDRLDYAALTQAKAEGLFAEWVGSGLLPLATSALPLEDKRKRVAWLLAQRPLLAKAINDEVVASLLTWLPAQDWLPVAYTLHCEQSRGPAFLATATKAKRADLVKRGLPVCLVGKS